MGTRGTIGVSTSLSMGQERWKSSETKNSNILRVRYNMESHILHCDKKVSFVNAVLFRKAGLCSAS